MRSLARFLGIDLTVLTTPTFNGYPVGANSSYEVRTTGVVSDPVDRYKEILSDEQRERIGGEWTSCTRRRSRWSTPRPTSSRPRGWDHKEPARGPPIAFR